METKRDLTKELLASCLKELMMTTPFDKITIKMITGKAGLIRPTFYKHFQDKYEVIEWIFQTEVASGVDLLIQNNMESDAVMMLLKRLGQEKSFYRRAYAMEPGPNSFEQILRNYVYETLLNLGGRFTFRAVKQHPHLTPEIIATYYTYSLVNLIRDWIHSDIEMSAEELADSYSYLLSHSVYDFLEDR